MLFKKYPVYIKIASNKVEITDLKTDRTVMGNENFSSGRSILADFNKLDLLIRKLVAELIPRKIFPQRLIMLIQLVEEQETVISEIEKRALRDLGELAGATKVRLVEGPRKLPAQEALEEIKLPWN